MQIKGKQCMFKESHKQFKAHHINLSSSFFKEITVSVASAMISFSRSGNNETIPIDTRNRILLTLKPLNPDCSQHIHRENLRQHTLFLVAATTTRIQTQTTKPRFPSSPRMAANQSRVLELTKIGTNRQGSSPSLLNSRSTSSPPDPLEPIKSNARRRAKGSIAKRRIPRRDSKFQKLSESVFSNDRGNPRI